MFGEGSSARAVQVPDKARCKRNTSKPVKPLTQARPTEA